MEFSDTYSVNAIALVFAVSSLISNASLPARALVSVMVVFSSAILQSSMMREAVVRHDLFVAGLVLQQVLDEEDL